MLSVFPPASWAEKSNKRKAAVKKVEHLVHKIRFNEVPDIVSMFLKDETIAGKLILAATICALLVVNTPWLQGVYESFWHIKASAGLGSWIIEMDLRHWVNELLMAMFFLVVGLEIKRELVHGELREFKKAMLPIGAAFGGMVVPALVYFSLNFNDPEAARGWGIPIATDIAFALAVLTILGKRVPLALKTFLLTLAIADDILAIFIIALFYAEIIHYGFLATSFAIIAAIWIFRRYLADTIPIFLTVATVLWITTHLSGIHASIVGTAIGLLAPMTTTRNRRAISEKLEKGALPLSTFIVLPLFAFANAGVVLSLDAFNHPLSMQVMPGIILGLVYGKFVGITAASWLLVKFGGAELPKGVNWHHVMGVGLIAGIGFTVSIFITELAFGGNPQLVETAKISIFIASALAAVLGVIMLLLARKPESQQ